MRRIAMVVMVLALAPLIMGGGINPPVSSTIKVSGPTVNAVIVLDPHGASGRRGASIWLQKGGATSAAVFSNTFVGVGLARGCNPPSPTVEERFAFSADHPNRLRDWIPNGPPSPQNFFQGDVLGTLFSQLGITVDATNDPVITAVGNVQCTDDPSLVPGQPFPGFLSFEANVHFAR
ncbi:MAG TPA: hypothetical protein VGU22_05150 [Methylomirabilota bacterium]|jgi:hypothetical protein|nr:hypothetical protein [Methylomirabilota bacterium]